MNQFKLKNFLTDIGGKTHFRYFQINKSTPKSSYGFRLEITLHHTNLKDLVQTSHSSTNHINTTIQCESSNIKMF